MANLRNWLGFFSMDLFRGDLRAATVFQSLECLADSIFASIKFWEADEFNNDDDVDDEDDDEAILLFLFIVLFDLFVIGRCGTNCISLDKNTVERDVSAK